jgi:serine/threonine-protein kinase HipA
MSKKCLSCYAALPASSQTEYHPKCSLDFFGSTTPPSLNYSLSEMNELAMEVVRHRIAVPGVQPKLSLSLIKDTTHKSRQPRLTVVGALGGNFIFKPPTTDYPEMPENEHLTMSIAAALRISTVPACLMRLKSGELAYITRRIDRAPDGTKVHMLDMVQITEAVDKYKSTMERVGKALKLYSSETLMDQFKFFELAVFCFVTGNNDMHLKNFSMIHQDDKWSLAPAYDLLNVNLAYPQDKEELALALDGRKKNLKRHHFERFGTSLGLNSKQIQGVFDRFLKNQSEIKRLIDASFMSDQFKEHYWSIMVQKFEAINKP